MKTGGQAIPKIDKNSSIPGLICWKLWDYERQFHGGHGLICWRLWDYERQFHGGHGIMNASFAAVMG